MQLSHNRKTLLKFLLRTIALSSYAPAGNLTATRPQDDDAQLLYASLKVQWAAPGNMFAGCNGLAQKKKGMQHTGAQRHVVVCCTWGIAALPCAVGQCPFSPFTWFSA